MEAKPQNGTDNKAVAELQEDVYGNERRHRKGIMDRLEQVEEVIELYKKDRNWLKAFVAGLGINFLVTVGLIISLWQALQKLP